MKNLTQFWTTTLCCLILGSPGLWAQSDPARDYAVRLQSGAISGIKSKTALSLGIAADFLAFYDNVRMIFGVDFIAKTDDTPYTGLQYLGIEYNLPKETGAYLLGLRAQRSYVEDDDSDLREERHASVYVGKKWQKHRYSDWVVLIGAHYKPFTSRSSSVNDVVPFVNFGQQFYF